MNEIANYDVIILGTGPAGLQAAIHAARKKVSVLVMGKETKGSINATLMSLGLGGFMIAAALPPTRWFMEKLVLPKPGEGPSPKAQKEDAKLINSSFSLKVSFPQTSLAIPQSNTRTSP